MAPTRTTRRSSLGALRLLAADEPAGRRPAAARPRRRRARRRPRRVRPRRDRQRGGRRRGARRSSAAIRSRSTRGGPVPVDGNPDELHRLVLNLLENAVRHTPRRAPTYRICGRGQNGEAIARGRRRRPRAPRGHRRADLRPLRPRRRARRHVSADSGTGLGLAIVRGGRELATAAASRPALRARAAPGSPSAFPSAASGPVSRRSPRIRREPERAPLAASSQLL